MTIFHYENSKHKESAGFHGGIPGTKYQINRLDSGSIHVEYWIGAIRKAAVFTQDDSEILAHVLDLLNMEPSREEV